MNGKDTRRSALYLKAETKSSLNTAKNMRVAPQPGHKYPVAFLNTHGKYVSVMLKNIASIPPTKRNTDEITIAFFSLFFCSLDILCYSPSCDERVVYLILYKHTHDNI